MQEMYTPTSARKNLFKIFKNVAAEHKIVSIQQKNPALDAVIINKKDWDALQEKLALANNGTLAFIQAHENEQDADFDEMWHDL